VIEDCLLCLFVGWLVFLYIFFRPPFFYIYLKIVYICGYNVTHYNLPILFFFFQDLSICADLFYFLPSQ
jgi:hypothetical protein